MKSEVGTLIKNIFGQQIEETVEKGLANSFITDEFTATMNVSKQKWKNIGQKGGQFYQYFKDNKMYQIKSCMPSEERANENVNSLLKPPDSTKCKNISEVAEKLKTAVKNQENQVILSLLSQGEWTLLETYKKYAIGDRY